MSTVFSEVYGTYYNVVAKVLTQALDGKLSAASMQQLVREGAYGDSVLQLLPALADGTWKLLTPELGTPLKNKPTMPLTALQKRWLKTLLFDEKISLWESEQLLSSDTGPHSSAFERRVRRAGEHSYLPS